MRNVYAWRYALLRVLSADENIRAADAAKLYLCALVIVTSSSYARNYYTFSFFAPCFVATECAFRSPSSSFRPVRENIARAHFFLTK